MSMLSHPMYQKLLKGIPSTHIRMRDTVCIYLGKRLEYKSTCRAIDKHNCDELGTVVIHNVDCQSCKHYIKEQE